MTYILDALTGEHSTETFDCGVELLNAWLKEHAMHAQVKRTARVFVWHTGDNNVVAYFSLTAHVVKKKNLPNNLSHGSPANIPAILLGKLGLDQRLHGIGLGSDLFHSALFVGLEATQHIGARLFVVDALDVDVARFYQHYKFIPYADNPLRLVRKVSDIRKELLN